MVSTFQLRHWSLKCSVPYGWTLVLHGKVFQNILAWGPVYFHWVRVSVGTSSLHKLLGVLTHTSVKSHWFRKISQSCLKVICQPGCSVTSFSLLVSHGTRYLLGSQGPLRTNVMVRQDGLLAAQETSERSAHSAVLYHAWEHMHVPASGKGSAKSHGLVISRLIPLLTLFLIHSLDFSGLQSSCQ